MNVMISVDMEGVAGVVSWVHVTPPEYGDAGEPVNQTEYERARLRMTREVNAAIEGAFAGGATGVIVNDSHDGMRNLVPEELDPRCRFISGNDKPLSMMQGVDLPDVAAAFFIGYHAKAGSLAAPLAHTWTGWLNDLRIGGRSTGEFGLNALVAGHFGVPVVLVSGDREAVRQTREFLGQEIPAVVTKDGLTTFSAVSRHPSAVQEDLRQVSAEAWRARSRYAPARLDEAVVVELDFDHQARAVHAARVPGIEQIGERTVRYRADDGLHLLELFKAAMSAASIRMSP